jgi:O-antigen/teichoic acid export membrane protein
VYIFAEPLATYGFKDQKLTYFIQAGSFLIILNVIESVSLLYFRVFRQIERFSYLTLFETFVKLFLILILLNMGYGLIGVIVATLIVQSFIFLISIAAIVSQIGFVIPRFTHMKKYLQFSLPLTPTALIRWVTESSDRYLVTYFLGLQSVGIYSAACSIGNLIQLLVSPLQLILLPEISKLFDENKIDQVRTYMSHSLRYFLLITIPAVFGLSALAKPLLGVFTTEEFLSGWFVIPIIALSGLLAGIFQIFVNIIFLVKETKYITYINIVAAASNVLLNLILIPSKGIGGAALSTLISYFLMIVLCIHVSVKHFVFHFYFYDVVKSIFSSLVVYLFVSHFAISNIYELFAVSGMGAFIYVFLMLIIGGFSKQEISIVKKFTPPRL